MPANLFPLFGGDVCFTIAELFQADRHATLAQAGQAGADSMRLPVGQFDQFVDRRSVLLAQRLDDLAEFAARRACS